MCFMPLTLPHAVGNPSVVISSFPSEVSVAKVVVDYVPSLGDAREPVKRNL